MTDNAPRISVVISTYNFAKYLRECIDSVLAQTLPPSEVIITDDCSTDESWSIITEYSERFPELIRAYRHEKNVGAPVNGNFGKQLARGELIAWLDGDDRWLPRLLEVEWDTLQKHRDAQVAYSNVLTIDSNGNRIGIWYDGTGGLPPSGDVLVPVFSRRVFPKGRSAFRNELMYRSTFESIGYNDLELESYWDWDRKIRLTSRFRVAYTGETLTEYRRHGGGLSSSQPVTNVGGMRSVFEKHLPLLDTRSQLEATRVKANIESLLAIQQRKFPPSSRPERYSARGVYDRNRELIDQLPESERVLLEKEVGSEFKLLALIVARDEAVRANARLAVRYLRESLRYRSETLDARLAAQIFLPPGAHSQFMSVYQRIPGRKRRSSGRFGRPSK